MNSKDYLISPRSPWKADKPCDQICEIYRKHTRNPKLAPIEQGISLGSLSAILHARINLYEISQVSEETRFSPSRQRMTEDQYRLSQASKQFTQELSYFQTVRPRIKDIHSHSNGQSLLISTNWRNQETEANKEELIRANSTVHELDKCIKLIFDEIKQDRMPI